MYSTDTDIPTLFELLARDWTTDAALTEVVFSCDSANVGFLGADGTLWRATTADPESPVHRFRVAADTGRPTISPRRRSFAPLNRVPVDDQIRCVSPGQGDRLVAGCQSGRVLSVSLSGRVSCVARSDHPIDAVCVSSSGGDIFVATGQAIQQCAGGGDLKAIVAPTNGNISTIAVSADGSMLAWSDQAGIHSKLLRQETSIASDIFGSEAAHPQKLRWNARGDRLAVGNLGHSIGLASFSDGQLDKACQFGNYPTVARSISWSHDNRTLVTSGGFRIVSWDTDSHPPTATSETKLAGRSRFVAVETVTCHPSKDLIAAGYQNGAIVVARPGVADDLVLRKAADHPPVAMRWSGDGAHLAFCTSGGEAAIVTFPASFFK